MSKHHLRRSVTLCAWVGMAALGMAASRQAMPADPATAAKAAVEFRKAVRAAPWLPALAFNLALVEETLKHYKAATANLKVYLASNPVDAEDIRKKVYALEVSIEDPIATGEEECDAGDMPGCARLTLSSGLEQEKSYANTYQGFQILEKSCGISARSCEALANKHRDPTEVPGANSRDAGRWLLRATEMRAKACEAGAPGAGWECFKAGEASERGERPRKDRKTAAQYYARGCDQGDQSACEAAARLKR